MWREIALAALRVAAEAALQDHTVATRHIFRGVLGIAAGGILILYALVARSVRARGRASHRDLLGIALFGGGCIVLGLSWLSWQAELIPWLLGIAGVFLAIVGAVLILSTRVRRSTRRP